MASEQEKEELLQTLKFTPQTYRVEIWGYGGEVYWGKVDRKIYDFFKEKAIDIEQYASSWEERMWDDIPFDLRPFDPGSPYECDDVHTSGATFDDSSHIVVYDETGAQVWTSPLGNIGLEANGATSDCIDERYINDVYEPGTPVFYGAQGEKGTFFGNDFEIKAPFDPSKLRVLYEDMDGWEITTGVQYDGEDIDGNDYDTNGKWGENKWIIVGDTEEVYEGEERDEDDYEDTSDDDEEITLDDDDESNATEQGG
jgi:hypothetical protein